MENDNEKQIGEMYLAAALLSYGAEISSVDRSNPKRLKFGFIGEIKEIFIFKSVVPTRIESPSLEDVELNYANKTLMFPPDYPDSIRRIKSVIHSG
jgi:hypothetical protein